MTFPKLYNHKAISKADSILQQPKTIKAPTTYQPKM